MRSYQQSTSVLKIMQILEPTMHNSQNYQCGIKQMQIENWFVSAETNKIDFRRTLTISHLNLNLKKQRQDSSLSAAD